jgi:hypothetical protein
LRISEGYHSNGLVRRKAERGYNRMETLHNEKLHNLNVSLIIRVITSNRMMDGECRTYRNEKRIQNSRRETPEEEAR